jgi:Tol biopolymer transport system component
LAADLQFCAGQTSCAGKNPRIKHIQILQQNGVRARWSPDGSLLVFDRKNSNGYFQVYRMTAAGQDVRGLTENRDGLPQRSNGNAIFHPSGKWVVFVSEENHHFMDNARWTGDPGIGLFSNLWATDLEGSQFWPLTHIPVKQTMGDGIPTYATVNPLFSDDGHWLVWTERYANGRKGSWRLWRLKIAEFVLDNGHPTLKNEKVLFASKKGNFVTAMGFLSPTELVLAGNLDGQHEYGMDQYVYNLTTHQVKNLTQTPEYWEEGSSVTPDHKIIYMSNIDSIYHFDTSNPSGIKQAMTREYYVMDADGGHKERLTYFNDVSASESVGKRVQAVACDVSPDGRYLAATLGVDEETGSERVALQLKIVRIEFDPPFTVMKP